ncbi:MAG: CHAT domain-containing tetratricopeptide repeat protein [Bacteroidota bacterium]
MSTATTRFCPNCHLPLTVLIVQVIFFLYSPIIAATPSDSLRIDSLLQEASELMDDYKIDEAIVLINKAQNIAQSGEQWSTVVLCYNRLAQCYDYADDSEQSWQMLASASDFAREHLPPDDVALGETWQIKGELYIQSNQLDSALLSFKRSSHINQKHQDWKALAWSDALAALVCYYQLDFEQMASYLDKTEQMAAEQLEEDDPFYASLYQFQLLLYNETGEANKAVETAEATINHRLRNTKNSYEDSLFLAVDYINLGTTYYTVGDYDQALHYYQLAIDIQKMVETDSVNLAANYINVALTYKAIGQSKLSIRNYKKALHLIRKYADPSSSTSIDCYLGLARNFIELGQLDSSQYFLDQVVLSGDDDPNLDLFYLNKAMVKKGMGALGEAKVLFQKGLQANKNIFGKYHVRARHISRYLGDISQTEDSMNVALAYYSRGLQLISDNFTPSDARSNPRIDQILYDIDALPYLQSKAQALRAFGTPQDLLDAFGTYELADALIDRLRSNFETEGSKQQLSSQVYSLYEDAIGLAYQLYQSSQDQSYIEKAFRFSEKSKALLLLEALSARSEYANQKIFNLSDSLLQAEKAIKARLIYYQRNISEEQAKGAAAQQLKIGNWNKELALFRSRYEALRSRIRKEDPDYFRLKYELELADVATIRQQLLNGRSDNAFIEYFSGSQQLYSFVITSNTFQMFSHPLNAQLNNAIDELQLVQSINPAVNQLISTTDHFQRYTQSAYFLYEQLLEPLLAEGIKKLILVPDGRLGYLSFDLLLSDPASSNSVNYSSNQLQYLIEDYQLSYGYSGSLLLESQEVKGRRATQRYGGYAPYVGGRPGAEQVARNRSCSDSSLGNLPNSQRSVKTVGSLLGGQQFFGKLATKTSFLENAAKYELLHLSTHACVDDTDPLFNRIYFHDAHLSTYELYRLQLNASMVVLSACETGTGQMVHGEGIMSLARGFMQSGCPSIITSLWNANDYSTTEIMIDFFNQLNKGISKDAALRQAKLNYLSNAPSRLSLPYFWATFIHIGHNAPLPPSRPAGLWWTIGGLALGGLLIAWFWKRRG